MFEKAIEEFNRNGFVLIPDFLTDDEVKELKTTVEKMVDEMDISKERLKTDSTTRPNIDVDAADKIKFFFEEKAFDKNGNLQMDKHRALFRIGFALHALEPTFKKVTFSDKVKTLVNELGYSEPCVAQSMYIFKNPEVGCRQIPHQDATYLHALGDEIREIGLWFPMEDADVCYLYWIFQIIIDFILSLKEENGTFFHSGLSQDWTPPSNGSKQIGKRA